MTKDHEEGQNSSEAEKNTVAQPQPHPPPTTTQRQHQQQEQEEVVEEPQQRAGVTKETQTPLNEQGINKNTSSTIEENYQQQSDAPVFDLHCHENNFASWVENNDEKPQQQKPP